MIAGVTERLVAAGLAGPEEIVGCTPGEVAGIRADHGVRS